MASNDSFPVPKFFFRVKFGSLNTIIQFQEVSGLDAETEPIEYRRTNSSVFSTMKMPGIKKYASITMKKGLFTNDNVFLNWYNKIKMNTITKETVTIDLLHEISSPVMTWTLNNAFPTKITSTDLKSDGNEVAIETLGLMHKYLIINNI